MATRPHELTSTIHHHTHRASFIILVLAHERQCRIRACSAHVQLPHAFSTDMIWKCSGLRKALAIIT